MKKIFKKLLSVMVMSSCLLVNQMPAYALIDWTWKAGNIHVPADNVITSWSKYCTDTCGYCKSGRDAAMVFFNSLSDLRDNRVVTGSPGMTTSGGLGTKYANSLTQHGYDRNGTAGNRYRSWYTATFNNVKVPTNANIVATPIRGSSYWHMGGDYWDLMRPVTTTFNANGGKMSNGAATQAVSGYTDSNVSIAAPTRAGYKFMGWSTNSGAASGSTTVKYISGTYYATWKLDKVNITFNANGGSGSKTESLTVNSTYTGADPTRNGYAFDGWYTAASGGTKWNKVVPAKATTYYAHWKPVTYNITYKDVNEGYAGPKTYTIETPTFTLPHPVKEDHIFQGFIEKNGEEPVKDKTVNLGTYGNKTFTAVWDALPPVITDQPDSSSVVEYTGLREDKYKEEHTDTENGLKYDYGTAVIEIKAEGGSNSGQSNTYEWEYSTDGQAWNPIEGDIEGCPATEENDKLTIENISRTLNGYQVRCKISNKSDEVVYTEPADLTVYWLPNTDIVQIENKG